MRDAKTENYLERGGYAWRFVENYQLSRINLAAEAANPARLGRRREDDRIIKMATAMTDGVPFPAIVVFANEDAPHDSLVTGLHRVTAADLASIEVLDAYVVVEHDVYRRALLPRSINVIEGKASTLAEDLAQIAELIRLFPNASQADLAAAFGVKQPLISDHLKLIEQEERANRLGVGDVWARITQQGIRMRLGRINNDVVFAMAANAVEQMRLTGRAADDLIDNVRKARTEQSATKIVQDALASYVEAQERAKAKYGKRPKQNACQRWFYALGRLWRVMPVWDVRKLHLDALDASAVSMNILKLKEVRAQIDDVLADQERRLEQTNREAAWRKLPPPGADGYEPTLPRD